MARIKRLVDAGEYVVVAAPIRHHQVLRDRIGRRGLHLKFVLNPDSIRGLTKTLLVTYGDLSEHPEGDGVQEQLLILAMNPTNELVELTEADL